jgi:hypothetical protein
MGGNPDERCRSDALFFTLKARSSVMSIGVHPQRRSGPVLYFKSYTNGRL